MLVDDRYQAHDVALLKGKPGVKPDFRDGGMIALMAARDRIPYPGEKGRVNASNSNHSFKSDYFIELYG